MWPWPSRTASWSHPSPDFSLMLVWDHRLKLTVGQWWRPAACSPSLCQMFTPVSFEVKRFSSDNRPKHGHVPLWHHQTNIWPHGQETGLSHADRTHVPLFDLLRTKSSPTNVKLATILLYYYCCCYYYKYYYNIILNLFQLHHQTALNNSTPLWAHSQYCH